MLGWLRNDCILIYRINCTTSFCYMLPFGIRFKAQINPLFLCFATNTSPNLPDPSFLPNEKSLMAAPPSSFYIFLHFVFEAAVLIVYE